MRNAEASNASKRLGLKWRKDRESNQPVSKRRIQRVINKLRQTVSKLHRYARGQIKDTKEVETILRNQCISVYEHYNKLHRILDFERSRNQGLGSVYSLRN